MGRFGMTVTALTAVLGASGGARADEIALDADTLIGTPATYQNLTFYPLVTRADTPPGAADYLVLDEGLKSGEVQVIEKGEGVVNTLTLKNQSKRPLFVMSGEVVIGGKQDRIIGKDQIISAAETVDVPVFCVEHGRWTESGDGRRFRAAGSMADTKVRKQAAYKDNQGQVWQKVAEKNAARGIANETGTYRQVATGGEVAKAVESFRSASVFERFASPNREAQRALLARFGQRERRGPMVPPAPADAIGPLLRERVFRIRRAELLDLISVTGPEPSKRAPPGRR